MSQDCAYARPTGPAAFRPLSATHAGSDRNWIRQGIAQIVLALGGLGLLLLSLGQQFVLADV